MPKINTEYFCEKSVASVVFFCFYICLMKYLVFILPAIAGMAISTQAGVNSQLRVAVNNPWVAAFISFLIGTLLLGLYVVVTRQPFPSVTQLNGIELYKYAGGLLGAFFVTVIILTVQKIGSANVFALVIMGQLLMALLYDHLGWFGFPQSNINWIKILGVILLVLGAYLINKK
jgi:transporter family-2 protein